MELNTYQLHFSVSGPTSCNLEIDWVTKKRTFSHLPFQALQPSYVIRGSSTLKEASAKYVITTNIFHIYIRTKSKIAMNDNSLPLLEDGPACAMKPRGSQAAAPDRQSLAASIATLILTLPALLGSCCWPVLLAGIIGITATAGAKAISHTFSLALTLAILTNLAQFMAHKAAARKGKLTTWRRYGPTYLLLAATPLVLADQVRHCLQDSGIWPEPGSSMYIDDCDIHGLHSFFCLTPIGWIFSIFFTYSGFSLMMVSILWSTNLIGKLSRAWNGEQDCGCDEP
ncbi:hypothetical protein CEUSTIGMA_g7641.t1 [Chlamydomonas eustigma]|uniref:Uncharacterized protein n=1 Tax=Chlamydomonas eustigma TaxID=1157962 RepID=A0A250XAQ7_9CHLO|nr:hypothetical protein CEUSTIGMA_g7641.t1 [Chlamydomonas eustigma]|eukprot:GAX80203.1 hypothetical protein CEUSTIGMA_g7641.t1 [Chlamydomonas eustigma]